MMKKFLLMTVCIIAAAAGAFGETLNLDQARTLALAYSRSLAKYNLLIQSSILNERSQLFTMIPSISANYNAALAYLNKNWGFNSASDGFSAGAHLELTQVIFTGGKNFIQKKINSIATESVRKDALAEYFNVLDSVDSAYYSVLEAQANLESAENSLKTALLSLSMAEIRQASGMIGQGDYLKALADKESYENARNQARRNVTLAQTKLKSLIGISDLPDLEPVDFDSFENLMQYLSVISDDDANALFERFNQIVTQSNPSLARAALNSQTAEKNLSLAKRDPMPTLQATVFSSDITYTPSAGFNTTPGGGVYLSGSIPIDFWVLNNNIQKSKVAVNSAALDYLSTESSLQTDLQSSLLGVFSQTGSVISTRRSLDYAQKNLEYVMERYKLSQSSVSDLSDAQALVSSTQAQLIQAEYGFLQSLSTLRSLGAIDDQAKLISLLTGESS
ncbi:MAG: TolC family protein [Treponema sp.]|nr:TolC family protein [Treponema sp.]